MRTFGLTGGIASGKSTVSRLWAHSGLPVIDADKVSRMVVEPNTPGYIAVIEAFGMDICLSNGELDRKALGRIVFADAEKRRVLNAIVHPRIAMMTQSILDEYRARGEHLVCYDAPLLFENNLQDSFRPVVVVTCPPEVQLQRIIERDGLSRDEAIARIMAQMPTARKVAGADIVIHNDAELPDLVMRARQALDEVRRLVTKVP